MENRQDAMNEERKALPSAGLTAATLSDASGQPRKTPDRIPIRVGDVLLDTYRVEGDENVGRSGWGDVRRVHHLGWGADMAMKHPRQELFVDEESKAAFVKEYEAWIGLGLHPNIVACYYVREIYGIPSIFSEWVDNGSLHDRIYRDDALYREGAARLLDIAIQFARGLRYAHGTAGGGQARLVHQDVKPSNLMISGTWEAKVTDFGTARYLPDVPDPEPRFPGRVTRDGRAPETGGAVLPTVFRGTVPYQSPEQRRGKRLSPRTDIYSWALSVLEMYFRSRPWESGSFLREAKRSETFPGRPEIPLPDGLRRLLLQCLAEDPADRPRSFAPILAALKDVYRAETGRRYQRPEPSNAPVTSEALNNQALSYLDLGRRDLAETLWNRALEANPANYFAVYNRAIFHVRHYRRPFASDMVAFQKNWGYLNANPEIYGLFGLFQLEYKDFEGVRDIIYYLEDDLKKLNLTHAETEERRSVADTLRQALEMPDFQGTYRVSRARNLADRNSLEEKFSRRAERILAQTRAGDYPEAASQVNRILLNPEFEGCITRPEWVALNEALREKCYPLVLLSHDCVLWAPDAAPDDAVSFSADSRFFLCGERLYDMESGELLADNRLSSPAVGGRNKTLPCLTSAISPDGSFYLRAVPGGTTVQKIHARTGVTLASYAHDAPVTALLISDDGGQFVSADKSGCISVREADGRLSKRFLLGEASHHAEVRKMQLNYDRECLLFETRKGLYLLNLASGESKSPVPYEGALTFCANSQFSELVVCEGIRGASLHNLQKGGSMRYGKLERELPHAYTTACFLSNDQSVMLANRTGIDIFFHSARTGSLSFAESVKKISGSRNGKYVAVITGSHAEVHHCVYAYGATAENAEDAPQVRKKIASSLKKLNAEEAIAEHMKMYETLYFGNPNPLYDFLLSYAYVISFANPEKSPEALLDVLTEDLRARGYGFTPRENALSALRQVRRIQISMNAEQLRKGTRGADRWTEAFQGAPSPYRGQSAWRS